MTESVDEELRRRLRARFEIGAHPLGFVGTGPGPGRVRFRTAGGEEVGGFLLEPEVAGPRPAILYVHAHGGRYEIGAAEVMEGRPALAGPMGPALAAQGFRVLAIDMPCFGGRAGTREGAAAKAAQWRGGSLAGQMLGELASALDWLAADQRTEPGRIGVFGLSMGATLGYWLAAVEPRVAAVAHLCCFADFGPLIESGAHDRHGHYLTVPGLLGIASNGTIAGLVAPRPQFVGLGDADPLTPPAATGPALAALAAAYRAAGAEDRLVLHREAATGHEETPAMRRAVLAFLREALGREG
jgi:dienelactone hydrolase